MYDYVATYVQSENQPILSFNEKELVIEACQKAIDSHIYFQTQQNFTKCLGICGIPGSGKTWTMKYMVLYGISKGLFCLTASMLAKGAIQLDGKH